MQAHPANGPESSSSTVQRSIAPATRTPWSGPSTWTPSPAPLATASLASPPRLLSLPHSKQRRRPRRPILRVSQVRGPSGTPASLPTAEPCLRPGVYRRALWPRHETHLSRPIESTKSLLVAFCGVRNPIACRLCSKRHLRVGIEASDGRLRPLPYPFDECVSLPGH